MPTASIDTLGAGTLTPIIERRELSAGSPPLAERLHNMPFRNPCGSWPR